MPEQFIYKKGENALEMYFMTDGLAERLSKRHNGTEEQSFRIKKGSFFGEIALLSNHNASRRREDVLAIDYCFVDVFTKYALEDLISEFPCFFKKVVLII